MGAIMGKMGLKGGGSGGGPGGIAEAIMGKMGGKGDGGWGGKGDGGWGGDGGKGKGKGKNPNPGGQFKVDDSGGTLGEFVGTIKSFSDLKGYGFIACPELEAYGDVFLHMDMKGDLQRYQTVSFTAVLTKNGKPQAKDVKAALN